MQVEKKITAKITFWFEQSILVAAQILLMAVILAMVIQLWIMFSSDIL